MGKIVSAVTGSGNKKAMQAQVEAANAGIAAQKEAYSESAVLQREAIAAQEKLAREGLAQQEKFFNIGRDELSPYTKAGTGALSQYQDLLYGAPNLDQARIDAMVKSPSYQFRMQEGQKALENAAAARSGVLSGAQLKSISRYGQDYAATEFDTYMNRLGGLADAGRQAAGAVAGLAGGVGSSQSQVLSQTGANTATILGNLAGQRTNLGSNIATAQTQIGAARAGRYIADMKTGAMQLGLLAGIAGGAAGGAGMLGMAGGMSGAMQGMQLGQTVSGIMNSQQQQGRY